MARAPEPSRTFWRWGLLAGLMAGVVQSHAVQPVAALTGALEWQGKTWVSVAGAVLYGVALALLLLRKRAGLWVAVLGPPAGFTAVLLGVLAVHLGWSSGPMRVDAFQVVGGVPQLAALWLAAPMLRRT